MDTYNLLIIDNDPNTRGLLNELLAGRPEFGILIAADGKEAARQLIANRIDIILADIHMPGFTGLELMASLTTLPMKPEILVMTANTTSEDIETARRIGARGMVQKPFDDLEKVEMQVNKALEAARAAHHAVLSQAGDASGVKAPDGASRPPLWPVPKSNPTPTAAGQTAAASKAQLWPAPKAAAPSALSQVSAAAHGPSVQATKPAAHPSPPSGAVAQSRQEVGRPAGQEAAPEEAIPELPPDIEAIFRTASSFDTKKMRMQVPIVCLQTWEEKRAIASLRRQAAALHREFYVWTAARGLLRDGSQSMGEIYGDAVRALEFIRRQKGNGLYVLADFRPRLEDERVVRMLREMVMEQDSARQLLVLTAPQLKPPAEMVQVCAVFDWPAGEGADLEALYEEVVTEAAASAGRDVGLEPEARDALLKRVRGMPAGRARFEIARALLAATSGN